MEEIIDYLLSEFNKISFWILAVFAVLLNVISHLIIKYIPKLIVWIKKDSDKAVEKKEQIIQAMNEFYLDNPHELTYQGIWMLFLTILSASLIIFSLLIEFNLDWYESNDKSIPFFGISSVMAGHYLGVFTLYLGVGIGGIASSYFSTFISATSFRKKKIYPNRWIEDSKATQSSQK